MRDSIFAFNRPSFVIASLLLLATNMPSPAQAAGPCGAPKEEPDELPTIAVQVPLFADHLGTIAPKSFDQATFTATLEQAIRGTRKFDVVTRNEAKLDLLLGEQDFAASADSQQNAAEKGFLLAVNLVVVPTITLFEFGSSHRPVPRLENRYHRREAGRLEAQIDVLDTETGQVIGSTTVRDSFATEEKIVSGKGSGPSPSRFVGMSKTIGEALVPELLATAFPILVVKEAKGNEPIYLNRGAEGGVKKGDILQLFKAGDVLVDPMTGQNLGSEETLVGQIKVTSVRDRFSTAEMLDPPILPEGESVVPCDTARSL
ncbi:MAG: CsgG/HfaB family protein [Pseudomonadota bacterium]